MTFFSSLGQVVSNKKNFKEWERKQADTEAQRKAYAKQNAPDKDTLEKAKKEGKVLIDIIDIMDTHSEDVAEKTETATIIPQMLAPYAAFLGSFGLSWKFIFTPANKKLSNAVDNYVKNNNETFSGWVEQIRNFGKKSADNLDRLKYFHNYDLANIKDIEKLKDIDDAGIKNIYKQAKAMFENSDLPKLSKNFTKKGILAAAIPMATIAASFVAATLWATKLQVNSSRIARWQSREQLKDPKYFVQYTPEQINEAKQIVDSKEQQEKGISKKLFKKQEKSSLIKVIKDNKNYKKWKKNDTDESKKVQRELTPEELIEAKKNKEVIQRVTRVINNKAEDYSENMEVAAETLIMGTPFLGGAVGALLGFIADKTGVMSKYAQNHTEKFIGTLTNYSQKSVKKAYEALKNIEPGTPGYKKISQEFASAVFDSSIAKKGTGNFLDESLEMIKKFYTWTLNTKGGKSKILGIAGAIITGTVGAIAGLKLQKASARAGRFLAKRELEQDPNNFIGYTEEELKPLQDVKGKQQTAGQKFKEYITFIPRVTKEYFEYQNYVKNEAATNRAVKEELVKFNVTDEQLKDAKNMQQKLFNTFEKVDDKSQEYSESVEAATEIAKPAVMYLGMLATLSPALIAAIQVARGKLTVPSVLNKVTGFLGEHTRFLKGKTANKYLNQIKANIPDAVRSTRGFGSSDIDIDLIKNIVNELNLKDIKNSFSVVLDKGKNFKNMTDEEFTKMLNNLPKQIKSVFKNSTKEQAAAISDNLQKILNNIPEEKLDEIFQVAKEEFNKNPEQFIELLKNGQLKDIFITKGVKIAGGIAAGTWGAITLAVTFAVESYLAKLQKEAGRLGVMKALEELDDPLYYADIEKNTPDTPFKATVTNRISNKYLR